MTKGVVAVALTWDGARWPAGKLPVKARAFLAKGQVLSQAKMTKALRADEITELRICWVPRLKGGPAVLCNPFETTDGKRIPFRMMKTTAFGDILGAVYRR